MKKTYLLGTAVTHALTFGVIMLGMVSTSIQAEIIAVKAKVTLYYVSPELPFTVGDELIATYSYETTTPDLIPADPERAFYDAITNLTVEIGNYSVSNDSSSYGSIIINNDRASSVGIVDVYQAECNNYNCPLSGSIISGYIPMDFQLQLIDSTATAFSSDALPTTAPNLAAFNSTNFARLELQEENPVGPGFPENYLVQGTVTSFVSVPDSANVADDVVLGDGTTIGGNTSLSSGSSVGDDSTIGADVAISKDAQLGDNTEVGDGSDIGRDVVAGDDLTVGVNVKIEKDVVIGARVTIGDNSTIRAGTVIGSDVQIGIIGGGNGTFVGREVMILSNQVIADGEVIPNNTTVP